MLAEWMTPEPITVDVDTPVSRCRAILEDGRIRHLPVLDGGWVVGVLDAVALEDADDHAVAGDLEVHRVPSVALGTPLAEALDALQGSVTDVVVITDGGAPVGLFTEHDAVRLGARELPEGLALSRYATRPLRTIDASASVADARARLAEDVQRHLVVMLQGKLYAVLSWRDLVGARDSSLVSERVKPVQWRIGWSTGMREAAATLARNHIGILPVVDTAGHPEAVVSRTDVMAALVEHLAG